jgi:sulfoxide reductase catalytic subunit YedY
MLNRRVFNKSILALLAWGITCFSTLGNAVRVAWAKIERRVVEKGTPMSTLLHADPSELDTSELETTPMSEFDVMGETTHRADLESWRLEVTGAVRQDAELSYQEILDLPVLERNALLICAGFFAYNGFWRGFSVGDLLRQIGLDAGVSHVKFSGPEGFRRKTRKFEIEEVLNDQIFIAYSVNDTILPERHGFPIRLVAEGHKGYKWVKYIDRVIVVGK